MTHRVHLGLQVYASITSAQPTRRQLAQAGLPSVQELQCEDEVSVFVLDDDGDDEGGDDTNVVHVVCEPQGVESHAAFVVPHGFSVMCRPARAEEKVAFVLRAACCARALNAYLVERGEAPAPSSQPDAAPSAAAHSHAAPRKAPTNPWAKFLSDASSLSPPDAPSIIPWTVDGVELEDSLVVTVSGDHTGRVWDVRSGECVGSLHGHKGYVWVVQVTDKYILTGAGDHVICVWDKATGKLVRQLHGHEAYVMSIVQVSPTVIASGGGDRHIRFFNIETGEQVDAFRAHTRDVWALLCWRGMLLSSSKDGFVRVWKHDGEWRLVHEFPHGDSINAMCVSGSHLYAGGDEHVVYVYNLETMERVQELHAHGGTVMSLHRIRDDYVVSGGDDSLVVVWDAKRTAYCSQSSVHRAYVWALSSSASTPSHLLTASLDHLAKLHTLSETGQLHTTATLAGHSEPVLSCAFLNSHKLIDHKHWPPNLP